MHLPLSKRALTFILRIRYRVRTPRHVIHFCSWSKWFRENRGRKRRETTSLKGTICISATRGHSNKTMMWREVAWEQGSCGLQNHSRWKAIWSDSGRNRVHRRVNVMEFDWLTFSHVVLLTSNEIAASNTTQPCQLTLRWVEYSNSNKSANKAVNQQLRLSIK